MRGRHGNPTTNNLLIPCFFIPDCFMLAGVVVLWYFMVWWTQTFTLHVATIPCVDIDYYSYPTVTELIPDIVVYVIAFVLPPIVMLFGEASLALYNLQGGRKMLIRERSVMTFGIKLHALLRRTVRFTGMFLLGGFVTWILTRAGHIILGRPAPNFFDQTQCSASSSCSSGGVYNVEDCLTTDNKQEDVRQSFPNLYSSLSAYAAVFVAVYITVLMKLNAAHTLRPFIGLCSLAVPFVLGLEQIAFHKAFWSDVIAGWLLGAGVAAYLIYGILDSFIGPIPASEMVERDLYDTDDDYIVENHGARGEKGMPMNGVRHAPRDQGIDGPMQETYLSRPLEVNGMGPVMGGGGGGGGYNDHNRNGAVVESWARGLGRNANTISGKRVPDDTGRGVEHYMY